MNKKILLFMGLAFTFISNGFGQSEGGEFMSRQREEAIEFNKGVTNEEIIEFIEFQYEIDPDMLKQFQDSINGPEKREMFFSNYRKQHNNAGIKLSTLKGMSKEDVAQLREIFKFKKQEYYESIEADKKLNALSNSQLLIVKEEGIELIKSYGTLNKDSAEGAIKIIDSFPEKLDFLELKLIYLTDNNCQLFLHKGIGKGIGFSISKYQGEWTLWSFNDYKSWDRHEVKFDR